MADGFSFEPTAISRQDPATQQGEVQEIPVLLEVFMVGCAVRAPDRVCEVESQRSSDEFHGMVGLWNVLHDTP